MQKKLYEVSGLILKLIRWTRPHRALLAAGVLCSVMASGLSLSIPILIGRFVSRIPEYDTKTVILLGLAVGARGAFVFCAVYWLGQVSARSVIDLRRQLFERYLHAPVSFHDHKWSASIVSSLTSDAAFIEQAFQSTVPLLSQHAPIILLGGVFLCLQNWRLAILLSLAAIPFVIFVSIGGKTQRKISRKGQDALAFLSVIAQESLQGVRVIKAMTQELLFARRFSDAAETLFSYKRRRYFWQALLDSTIPFGVVGIVVFGIYLVHWQLENEQTTMNNVAVFLAYVAIMGISVQSSMKSYVDLEGIAGAAGRLLQIYSEAKDEVRHGGVLIKRGPGVLHFDNVTYVYPTGIGGVREINLHISSGESIALVGPNGAGKSTLVHLMTSFYTPQEGTITLDGHAMESADIGSWRRQFAVVTRDPSIFSMSVGENISLGKPGASQSEIEAAVWKVGLHDFIRNLPKGYSSQVGESGVLISTGQRQRLALARVFLQDPSVIILDEATTSLDAEGKTIFAETLKSWAGRRTIIHISHDLDPTYPISRAIYMRAGRIVRLKKQKKSR
jgi:ABC-type multidrug transport system fused ATPase/permease subunit